MCILYLYPISSSTIAVKATVHTRLPLLNQISTLLDRSHRPPQTRVSNHPLPSFVHFYPSSVPSLSPVVPFFAFIGSFVRSACMRRWVPPRDCIASNALGCSSNPGSTKSSAIPIPCSLFQCRSCQFRPPRELTGSGDQQCQRLIRTQRLQNENLKPNYLSLKKYSCHLQNR